MKVTVAQLAKRPEAGKVKTRMQPTLSAEQACALHEALLTHCAHALAGSSRYDFELWTTGPHPIFDELSSQLGLPIKAQCAGDLGVKLEYIVASEPASARVLIGSDCPFLTRSHLHDMIDALTTVDAVFIPADDGGYVALALKTVCSPLFRGIDWGSAQVMTQSRDALRAAGLSWIELPPLADIDRPEDLSRLAGLSGFAEFVAAGSA